MKIISSLFLISFLVACTLNSENSESYPTQTIEHYCDEMVGPEWVRSENPVKRDKLISMANFHVKPTGIIWYTSSTENYMVCAFTNDPNGCGYGTHEFRKFDGRWFYAPVSMQEKICVVE